MDAAAPVSPAATPPANEGGTGVVDGARSGLANTLRGVGEGVKMAGEFTGVRADYSILVPVEASFAVSKKLGAIANEKDGIVGFLAKQGSTLGTVGGFVSAFGGLIVSQMLRSPGAVASDLTGGLADRIDGGQMSANDAKAQAAGGVNLLGF